MATAAALLAATTTPAAVALTAGTASAAASSCSPAFTDAAGDDSWPPAQPQQGANPQVDIVSGGISDDGTSVTTSITVKQMSTTPVSGATANEYYMTFTGADGKQYFTSAEVASTGTSYSYGTYDGTQYSGTGTATGSIAGNTISVTAPLGSVGGGATGAVVTSIYGDTFGLVGAPSNPIASGGSLQPIDHGGPGQNYAIGVGCSAAGGGSGGTGGTGGGTTQCASSLCFGAPVVLPKSSDTGDTSKTCYNPCGEPSLAVSPVDGRLYVSTPRTIVACCNTQSSPVWTSSDDGTTWSDPIFPKGAEDATTGGDTELAVDKRGTVYEGELWLGSDSIYVSSDKGASWDWSPASHDVGADREWFAYSPNEDALYGWYDGFKGLMVVKAPLSTPLGSNTAKFFPQETVAVPECPDLATSCPKPPVDSVGSTPVLSGDVSPGRPSVAPDGTVYFPFPYQVKGKGIGVAATTDGLNFSYGYVTGAGGGTLGDTGNDFPVSAVDSAGRLYVAWIEDKGDGLNLYLSSSGDKGQTWTTPYEVSSGISKTAVFPNVVAGAPGHVAVSWYGTDVQGDPNNATTMGAAKWNVYVAQLDDATAATPAATVTTVQNDFHTGVICTGGLSCSTQARKLLDFFDMKLDPQGQLLVVYTRDVGNANTEIAFARQTTGCSLTTGLCTAGASLPEFPAGGAAALAAAAMIGAAVVVGRRRWRLRVG